MARYYCEYCHSYLTHDTLSVRKSHLVGKNHLRVVADYYRNKQLEQDGKRSRGRRGKTKRTAGATEVKIEPGSLLTRREKRAKRRVPSLYPLAGLSSLYRGSPGYNRVFISENRFDIASGVASSQLPQRANTRTPGGVGTQAPRDAEFDGLLQSTTPLAPPLVLSAWSSTVPKRSVFHGGPQHHAQAARDSRKRIVAHEQRSAKRRRY
ncbi:Yhc1p KNAG_0F03200 [Huiozyma naganishii CBS 8797]|uniref:Matrin-type domain-containing protein n=1 Tax=Huiozyma naganishii (strain ATCC MYA-139 / BCRC 22969 / CBS 8797 / KCTC 17520 / NBRC 10181 / NCYC 3082 / Yp74L-3) TaxID=1071383 RepID=J7S0G8_HUIN7|nr:hypothetical protein KNAG_0F03200 [Kazachstania naganishii CBS 8797]CCK70982.1 hypothetical protein KNAG_0F03200 [Kazachstania naganishii CBS 8797]